MSKFTDPSVEWKKYFGICLYGPKRIICLQIIADWAQLVVESSLDHPNPSLDFAAGIGSSGGFAPPANLHVVSALQDKLHDLRSAVTTYEELLERTRHELAVVTATLSLFKRGDDRPSDHRPAHVRNLFKRGEQGITKPSLDD